MSKFLGSVGWPAGILGQFELQVCCDAPPSTHQRLMLPETFPQHRSQHYSPVLFFYVAQHLAGVGYEVFVLDHPYETDIVEFPRRNHNLRRERTSGPKQHSSTCSCARYPDERCLGGRCARTFVQVGTTVPAEVLIKGMIIQSGNDATIALAERVGGSEPAFAQLMNEYSKRLGRRARTGRTPRACQTRITTHGARHRDPGPRAHQENSRSTTSTTP